jgi:hypothetical protein
MAQQLRILQSLWAMDRRRADEAGWPLETQLNMIRHAGFDGAGVRFIDPVFAAQVTSFLREYGVIWEAQLSDQCQRSGAARLAAIPVGASPTNRGVQSLL